MAKPTTRKSGSEAALVRIIINALCEAGEYDLADAVWAFVRSRQEKAPAECKVR